VRDLNELTTSVVIGTDCIGSCKSNYYMNIAENEFKDFRMQKKYSPEQQKVFLLHAFFQVFLLIFSFACIYLSFLVHFQFL
jgi:hypothetical protein